MYPENHNNPQNQANMEIAQYYDNNPQAYDKPDIRDEASREQIKNISRIVSGVYDRLASPDNPVVQKFEERLANINFRLSGKIMSSIREWLEKRKELIKAFNSSADELDKSALNATFGRFFGSSIDLLYNIDTIFDKKISGSLTEQAFSVSGPLGLITQGFFSCMNYFSYVGLIASFNDILNCELIVRRLVKVTKEDMELFEEIEEWMRESDQFNQEIQDLFQLRIDSDLVADINEYFADSDSHAKIFTLLFIGVFGRNPSILRDESRRNELMYMLYLFSKSDVAEEWFERCLNINHPLATEAKRLEFRQQLMDIAKSVPNSESTMEVGGQIMKIKVVPHLIQASMNCISLFYLSRELMEGVKHNYSHKIRELAKKARDGLIIIETLKHRLESR